MNPSLNDRKKIKWLNNRFKWFPLSEDELKRQDDVSEEEIHHILPVVQPEEHALMPDQMQYAVLTTAPPPFEAEIPHNEESSEPVLPPGE